MTGSAFAFRDVTFAYRGHQALDGASFAIDLGQRVALLGANGSGKSTLLRMMDALCFPDGGTATAFATALTEAAFQDEKTNFAFRRRVGLVFQNPDVQLFNPTVLDELAFPRLTAFVNRECRDDEAGDRVDPRSASQCEQHQSG